MWVGLRETKKDDSLPLSINSRGLGEQGYHPRPEEVKEGAVILRDSASIPQIQLEATAIYSISFPGFRAAAEEIWNGNRKSVTQEKMK